MTNWSEIRKQFPVTETVVYLNTAAAGPISRGTSEAASLYYRQMMQDGDIHWDEWLAKREEVRSLVARFINAEPDEIGLTTNTSSGMNIIVDALENHGEVISCDLEFPVTTITWMNRRIPVHLVQSRAGAFALEDIRRAMNVRTGVISLSHVQFSTGFRIDPDELGNIKGNHALVVNASQSAGVFDIDVKRMKIDALCATGHKWMLSGYGSGFVYVSRELLDHSKPRAIGWLSLQDPYGDRNDEVRLRHDLSARAELGCPHFAGIFALGASVQTFLDLGIRRIQERALDLNRNLTDKLSEKGLRVLSPLHDEAARSAETLIEHDDPAGLVARLAQQKILVTQKPQGIRVATNFFNSTDDTDQLLAALVLHEK